MGRITRIVAAVLPVWLLSATVFGAAECCVSTGVTRPIATLNGVLTDPNDPATWTVINFVQESLVDWQNNSVVPELATSAGDVEGTPGHLFRLSTTARWHDGVDFTAADVIFTFDQVRDPALGSPFAARLEEALADDVPTPYFAHDDDTLVIVFAEQPAEQWFPNLVIPIVPKHLWESISPGDWATDPGTTGEAPGRVVGTGPYRFLRRIVRFPCPGATPANLPPSTSDEEIVLERNANFGDRPSPLPVADNYSFHVYACPRGELTPEERLKAAMADGIIEARLDLPTLPVWDDLAVASDAVAGEFAPPNVSIEVNVPGADPAQMDPAIAAEILELMEGST